MAHGVPFLSLTGQLSAVCRQWTSNAVLVDRREELPPAEANVDLLCCGKVLLGRSIALQRQRRLSAELAEGWQAIFAEGVVDVLVAAE